MLGTKLISTEMITQIYVYLNCEDTTKNQLNNWYFLSKFWLIFCRTFHKSVKNLSFRVFYLKNSKILLVF